MYHTANKTGNPADPGWIRAATRGPGRGRLERPEELILEHQQRVGDVDRWVVVDVGGVAAGNHGATEEAGFEDGDRVGDVDRGISVRIAAQEELTAMLAVVDDALGIRGVESPDALESRVQIVNFRLDGLHNNRWKGRLRRDELDGVHRLFDVVESDERIEHHPLFHQSVVPSGRVDVVPVVQDLA